MSRRPLNVFSIPPGEPFLEVLAERLVDGRIVEGFPAAGDPLALARATILLPTRRACRALQDVFLARAGRALLLPRIRPIGEVEAGELDLEDIPEPFEPAPDLPQAIRPLERQLALTRLILGALRASVRTGPTLAPPTAGEAAHLAGELARLMDMMATEGISWDGLARIVPEELQRHFELSLDFLRIATQHWPDALAERGLIEPAERRRLLMEAETARLVRAPVKPVIAAGSTGSIPATAALLLAIARLPQGALVLPGLDRDLDEDAWSLLARERDEIPDPVPSHPQTSLRQLMRRLDDLRREDDGVRILTLRAGEDPALRDRERLLAEAMRPAETTDAWATRRLKPERTAAALADVALIEAANEQEEALVIALALRETLETPGRTAALVTPDRTLARRVAAELRRFGIEADDTSGRPLADTPAGTLAQLVASVARDAFEPIGLLALLKHPLAGLGLEPREVRRGARALERLALRGPRPASGSAGLLAALGAKRDDIQAAKGLREEDLALARTVATCAAAILAPLETALAAGNENDLGTLVGLYADAVAGIAATADDAEPLRRREDGRALRAFLDELAETVGAAPAIRPGDFPELLVALMGGEVVRGRAQSEPRLRIYGLLEARLMTQDRVVLGGLIEGTWPATTRTDPWLSRGMRADLTLPAPERRIGLSAHDFCAALGTRDAILTRALKAGGAPTVPSRWLQRLFAVAGRDATEALKSRGARLLAFARALDRHEGPLAPVACPEPRPPVAVRPDRLSVTAIETLIRDPYSIYARHVLRLRPFEAIGEEPGAAERGTLIHDTLDEFAASLNEGAQASEEALLAFGAERFRAITAYPELHAFWWPRFCRIARWYIAFESLRRSDGTAIFTERKGELPLALPSGRTFTLSARADRFEQRLDGTFAVLDFKTGRVPGAGEVQVGFAPQLPLEAAMAVRGAFGDIPAGFTPTELAYVALTGREPPGDLRRVPRDGEVETLVEQTFAETVRLLARFEDVATGYRSLAASQKTLRYGDYDHLARVREWGLADEERE